MTELDLLKQFRADTPEPSADAWSRARAAMQAARDGAPTARARGRRIRAVRTLRGGRPLIALTGAGAAVTAVLAALALTPGATPTALARAFPILRAHSSDVTNASFIRSLSRWLPAASAAGALADAHQFAIPDATGYVIQSPDTSTLCLVGQPDSGPALAGVLDATCAPAATAEQYAMVLSFGYPDLWHYAALVPAGGSVELTDDGTTIAVPIEGGIAAGVVHDAATLTIQVGSSTRTYPLDGPPPPPSSPQSAPANG